MKGKSWRLEAAGTKKKNGKGEKPWLRHFLGTRTLAELPRTHKEQWETAHVRLDQPSAKEYDTG